MIVPPEEILIALVDKYKNYTFTYDQGFFYAHSESHPKHGSITSKIIPNKEIIVKATSNWRKNKIDKLLSRLHQ